MSGSKMVTQRYIPGAPSTGCSIRTMDAETPDMLTNAKGTLRASMRRGREALSAEEWDVLSERIRFHVGALEVFSRARSIHSFWPLSSRREVDLRPLLRQAHASGKQVWLPIVSKQGLIHAEYTSDVNLTDGAFGVKEPSTEHAVSIVRPDLILVPALAVDSHGNRLGYGGGYYDRFLGELLELGHHPPVIATAYAMQMVEHVPVGPLDVAVDATITDDGIHWHNARQDWV